MINDRPQAPAPLRPHPRTPRVLRWLLSPTPLGGYQGCVRGRPGALTKAQAESLRRLRLALHDVRRPQAPQDRGADGSCRYGSLPTDQ